ncbi:elongation factor G [Phaeovulum sp.]|jgi:elongation factor G|uniref:elongation factor G n=1 Tax=Phaeovulum sp. TaxID=2934796 RepID=UPI00272F6603|nr:elongation factor G [Phaeovulum sp.]MDP1669968.1 elongation factor G [Phaeovulum sp.]MDZ4118680.1 elongation factor G [Phaeovulum sp.]
MRCFTVLGPSQSGKTTLVRALSQLEGATPRTETAGNLALTRFTFLNEPWCALDVAGGAEPSGTTGSALAASDAVILCVPSDPAAAVLAAPYLRVIEASGTPCLIFINKMDTPQGRVHDIVSSLQGYSQHTLVLRQIPIREGGVVVGAIDLISERAWHYQEGKPSFMMEIPDSMREVEHQARAELLEHLSEFDDGLLEELIEDREPPTGELFQTAARILQDNKLIPAYLGAASHVNGVMRLMKALRHEAPSVATLRTRLSPTGEAIAVGFHAEFQKHLGKAVYLRALGDGVKAGTTLAGGNVGNLTELGETGAATLAAGSVGVAVKADHLNSGRLFTASSAVECPDWVRGHRPILARILLPSNERDEARMSTALARMQETDLGIEVAQDEDTGHSVLRVQGPLHLRRILASIADDFDVKVTDQIPGTSYRETISRQAEEHYRHRKQSGGSGQFADVVLIVRPQERGAGFAFDEVVKGGAVPRNFISSVEEGARDATKSGPLGFPVIDVAVTLTDGKHHAVDSSDHAFRTAAKMGTREALQNAGPVLLQPIERMEIHAPSVFSGAIVSLISTLKGQVLGFEPNPEARGWDVTRLLLPGSSRDDLIRGLGTATQGTGWFESSFDHYQELHGKEAEAICRAHAKEHA